MASRDLSVGVNLIGRDVSASKALNQLGIKAKSTGDVLASMSKKASYAIAAVGAAAVTATKAAMEDQKAAANLANTLKNVVNANDKTVASVENYISKTTLASSISDDQLRPALGRLVIATGSITKAQKLLSTAMDVGIKYNVDTETAAKALSKAYNGNATSLGRLTGIAFPKAKKGVTDFNKVMELLTKNTGGALNAYLDTAAGKFAKSTNAITEAQEALGYALIPYMVKFADLLSTKITPFIERNQDNIIKWGKVLLGVAIAIKGINIAWKTFEALQGLAALTRIALGWIGIGNAATAAGTRVAAAGAVGAAGWAWLAAAVIGIAALTKFVNDQAAKRKAKLYNPSQIPSWSNKSNKFYGGTSMSEYKGPKMAKGGIVSGPTMALIGEAGPEAVIPLSKMSGLGGGVNIYVAGSVIHEKDLAITVRDNIAQLMRRRGINPSPILGV